MAEIPKIRTPVECDHGDEYGHSFLKDADGHNYCCDFATYINATEAALRELCKHLRNNRDAVVNLKRLGLWREPE